MKMIISIKQISCMCCMNQVVPSRNQSEGVNNEAEAYDAIAEVHGGNLNDLKDKSETHNSKLHGGK